MVEIVSLIQKSKSLFLFIIGFFIISWVQFHTTEARRYFIFLFLPQGCDRRLRGSRCHLLLLLLRHLLLQVLIWGPACGAGSASSA